MPKPRKLDPAPVFDPPALAAVLAAHGSRNPAAHARALVKHLLRAPLASRALDRASLPDDVPGLPARLAAACRASCALLTSRVVGATTSADGSTTKLLVELQDGLRVEVYTGGAGSLSLGDEA